MSHRLLAWVVLAVTVVVTSGCARVSFSRFLGEQLGLTGGRLANEEVAAFLQNLPVAQMLVQTPGRNPSVFLLASLEGTREVWVDAAGLRLVRDRGQVIEVPQLAGLRGQFQSLSPLDASPFGLDRSEAEPAESSHRLDTVRFLIDGPRISEQRVRLEIKGEVQLAVANGGVPVLEVHEEVEDEAGRRWVNRHWLLLPSRYVLRSDFKWEYAAPRLRLDVLKAPATALGVSVRP